MTKASDLEVNIDVVDDDGLSQLRCRTCGKPVIGISMGAAARAVDGTSSNS